MRPPYRTGEKSFTLIETLIALGIMVTLVLQIAIVQGQAISFSDYARDMTKGMWLAKSILSQVEYQSKFIPLKEMKYDEKEQTFSEVLCPKENDEPCRYTYNLKIENWPLDLVDIFFRNKPSKEGKEKNSEENPMMDMIKEHLKEQIGEELISYVHAEVFWAEGSRLNSIDLAYLLTDQIGLDTLLQKLPPLGGDSKEGEASDKLDKSSGDSSEASAPLPSSDDGFESDEDSNE